MAPAAPGSAGRTRRQGEVDGTSAIVDAASVRAKGGIATGRNPTDRGKKGSKLHVASDAGGIPLAVAVSAASTHDSLALTPLICGIPAVRSRRGPRRQRPDKLRADKAYASAGHLAWLQDRGIVPRIARPGIESSERPGRHRWKNRAVDRPAVRLPAPHRPLRTTRKPLPRLPGPRGRSHLLQETCQTHHMRHALIETTYPNAVPPLQDAWYKGRPGTRRPCWLSRHQPSNVYRHGLCMPASTHDDKRLDPTVLKTAEAFRPGRCARAASSILSICTQATDTVTRHACHTR